MNQEIKEIEVIFDASKVLKLVSSDQILDEIFRDGNDDISYNMLLTLSYNNSLSQETLEKLENIFNQLVLKNSSLLEKYNAINISQKSKKNKLPKHYGKKRILEDIKNNNSTTELDRAMLALNTLRNITSKLRARGIKDKMKGVSILTDSDCRDIVAVVRIVENKVYNILKKK